MESWRSRLLRKVLLAKGIKKKWGTPKQKRRYDSHFPNRWVRHGCSVEQFQVQKNTVTILKPKRVKTKKILFFIHGGAFVYGPTAFHWEMLCDIAKQSGCVAWMVTYPKTPEYQVVEVVDNIIAAYQSALKRYDASRLVLAGDSAGGNLLLVLSLKAKELGLPQPAALIPICPLVDGRLSNPEILAVDKREPLLNVQHLHVIRGWYLGRSSAMAPFVSPLFGDLSGLPPIYMFIATDDILMPDGRLFVEKAREQGTSIRVYEGKDMVHVWPIFPIPEAKQARKEMVRVLLE